MKKSHRPKIRTDKLRKLAEHVLRGKRIHDRFDMRFFHAVNCKSAGCLFGEAPAVWPKFFSFSKESVIYHNHNGDVKLHSICLKAKGRDKVTDFRAAQKWFGLTEYEAECLFNAGDELSNEDYQLRLLLKPMMTNVTAKTAAWLNQESIQIQTELKRRFIRSNLQESFQVSTCQNL